MIKVDVPLVVCVSADPGVRERIVRRLDDVGAVLMCSDLAELRATLFPAAAGQPIGSDMPPSRGPAADLDDLVVSPTGHEIRWRGAALPLTRLERDLLARLAARPVRVWTYQRLFDSVWGGTYLGDTAIVHTAVKRLRRKLRALAAELQVETVRGVGYRLAAVGPPL